MKAQSVRRGLPLVKVTTGEGVTRMAEGGSRIVPDIVTSRPDITMGDEGVPNPSQYILGKRTRI